jgi:hypothetical protein
MYATDETDTCALQRPCRDFNFFRINSTITVYFYVCERDGGCFVHVFLLLCSLRNVYIFFSTNLLPPKRQ